MRRFAAVADAIAATSSKLEKTRLLADHLASLDDERLPVAARYFGGTVLPPWDGRVVGVGGAALGTALYAISGLDEAAMRQIWARHADGGGTAEEVLQRSGRDGAGGLDLLEVAAAFSAIADTSGTHARTRALTDLLARCSPAEGKYVVKLLSGEMRIGLREGLVEEAIGRAFARDSAAVQRANMLTGDLGETALLARHDRLAEAAPRPGVPIRFMLASPVADAAEVVARMGEEVWVEDKYDGVRCQLHVAGDRVALFSRDLRDMTGQFPEVAGAAHALPDGTVLDGEVLAFRDGRVLPFQDLQTRLNRKAPSRALLERVPVVLTAWDLLHIGSESLLDTPLRERRARLEALGLGGHFALAHQERVRGVAALDDQFTAARARLNEGLIAKDPDSPYTPGRRGLAWLKLKRPLDTLDCVVVGAEWGYGKRHGVLSDVTFAVRVDGTDDLVPVGKAYTGLTDAEIAEMTRMLLDTTVEARGRYRVVEPRIVIEVAFDLVQPSSRHRSGFAMRFPRIARWRHDKGVADIDTLSRVREIADAIAHNRTLRVDRADEGADVTPH